MGRRTSQTGRSFWAVERVEVHGELGCTWTVSIPCRLKGFVIPDFSRQFRTFAVDLNEPSFYSMISITGVGVYQSGGTQGSLCW